MLVIISLVASSLQSPPYLFFYQQTANNKQSLPFPLNSTSILITTHILSILRPTLRESLNMSPTVVPSHQYHHANIPRQNSSSSSSSSSSTSISISSKKLMLTSPSAHHQMQPPLVDSSSSHSSSSSYYLSSSSSSSSFSSPFDDDAFSLPFVSRNWGSRAAAAAASPFKLFNSLSAVASMFRSFIPALQSLLIPTCHWLAVAPPNKLPVITQHGSGRRKRLLTGTFFGQKRGRVSFAVQETPRSEPLLLLELATTTSHLVKEMASGMVRILLECQRTTTTTVTKNKKALWDEPVWTMYCNGHKLGYATSRDCTTSDFHVLSTVQTVSVGAGVMPAAMPLLPPPAAVKNSDCGGAHAPHPEIMYMRSKFDRVIGSRDSEAFYMINPDCSSSGDGGKFNSGGPELSIFMLRI